VGKKSVVAGKRQDVDVAIVSAKMDGRLESASKLMHTLLQLYKTPSGERTLIVQSIEPVLNVK
jgi:hypothetical protein